MKQEISRIIALWTKTVCARVKNKWASMSGIEGESEITASLPQVVGGMIFAEIVAKGGKAWIAEFGSGHLLDTSSPYFEEYKRSDRWNTRREADGNEFIGRAAGEIIYHPDGTTSVSAGRAEGMRLEHALGDLPPLKAFTASHVIRDEVTAAIPEIVEAISKALAKDILKNLRLNINVYI